MSAETRTTTKLPPIPLRGAFSTSPFLLSERKCVSGFVFTKVRLYNVDASPPVFFPHLTLFDSLLLEGSHMECQYALFSFGIRRDQFPLTADGVLKREHFLEWQRNRQAIEEANLLVGGLERPPALHAWQQAAPRQLVVSPPSINDTSLDGEATSVKTYPEGYYVPHHHLVDVTSNAVLSPTPNDVLFGRGKAIKEHPANIVLYRLVGERMLEYEMSSKWEKTVTSSEIMAMIKERHGRFLKMEGNHWVEVDSEVAREKVSHVFRSQRRRLITSSAAS
jgi:hypothetical protein